MRFVLDANIVVSAIIGRRNPIAPMIAVGAELLLPEPQAAEVVNVLRRKFGVPAEEAHSLIDEILVDIGVVTIDALQPAEGAARRRLEARGQSDWPVLAAAMELHADIWSNDRDFFGVGVAVWKTANIPFSMPTSS